MDIDTTSHEVQEALAFGRMVQDLVASYVGGEALLAGMPDGFTVDTATAEFNIPCLGNRRFRLEFSPVEEPDNGEDLA